jgi:hypothetical protein
VIASAGRFKVRARNVGGSGTESVIWCMKVMTSGGTISRLWHACGRSRGLLILITASRLDIFWKHRMIYYSGSNTILV